MAFLQKLIVLAGPLLLLALTAIAGYAYSQVRFLSLPISQALGLFTVVLPLITGISTQGAYGLIQRFSHKENYQLTIPLIAVIGFQLIYETIIATLAMTYVLPPSALACGLNQKWQFLFAQKNEKAIRNIQDSFNCCGFNSVVDRAFPFAGGPSKCSTIYGRKKSCFGDWRKAEQTNAGLFLLVAFVVFLIKVVSIISLLTGPSWAGSRWAYPFRRHTNGDVEQPEEDNRATMRRLIEDGTGQGHYHDEPAEDETNRATEASGNTEDHGSRVVPSLLADAGNEWRNEGESR